MFLTKIHILKLFSFFVVLIFTLQVLFQSIPISKTITINGDTLCTCGCGHTVAQCSENHGSGHMNCACEHNKDEQTQIIIIPNKIDVFIPISKISEVTSKEFGECHLSLSKVNDQYINDVSVPPPQSS